jgi:hypothetical protein
VSEGVRALRGSGVGEILFLFSLAFLLHYLRRLVHLRGQVVGREVLKSGLDSIL